MSEKFLIVYNACEIRRNNLLWYIDCITNLLNQDYDNFKVAFSGCRITEATKIGLQKRFGNSIYYSFIDEDQTISVTFNHTVNTIVKAVGEFDGYIYVDSGMNPQDQRHILKEIHQRSQTKEYGMLTVQSTTDTAYTGWFGKTETYTFTGEDFNVPVGKCCAIHFQYFNPQLLKYYGRLLPDIFKSHCIESVFSFMNAALKLKWVFIKDLAVTHVKGSDGPSLGFEQISPHGNTWNNLLGGVDIHDVLVNDTGRKLGMGYEEVQNVMVHDPAMFDENGFAKNEGLKDFIRESLFVKKNIVDYDAIKHQLIV